MLKGTNNDQLLREGVSGRYHLFYQVWKELTDWRTISTYQYKMMNPLNMLGELIEVIGLRLSGVHATDHNVAVCREEALSIIESDPVIEKYYSVQYKSLKHHLHKKIKHESSLRALRLQLRYLLEQLEPDYLNCVFDDLEAAIAVGDGESIIRNAGTIVSICASSGWSTQSLYRQIDVLKSSHGGWKDFRNSVAVASKRDYSVCIPFILRPKGYKLGPRELRAFAYACISKLGIDVMDHDMLVDSHEALAVEKMQENSMYMVVNVKAFDPYSACYDAIELCSSALNLLAFYNNIEPWNSTDVSCWVVDLESGAVLNARAVDLYPSLEYMVNNKSLLDCSIELVQSCDSTLGRKLDTAFAYASMGKAAGSQEERFMNTWIALESFCEGRVSDSIISGILESVPSALCARYLYKLVRNFIDDCRRCGVELVFFDGVEILKERSLDQNVKTMIQISRDSYLSFELLVKCRVNDLLVHRCRMMIELMHDRHGMIERVKRHEGTMRQQISRLYRVRNSIAHHGASSIDALARYNEHLNEYLVGSVMEVAMRSKRHGFEKAAELVFEMLKDNYAVFEDLTKEKSDAKNRMLADFFEMGVIDLV